MGGVWGSEKGQLLENPFDELTQAKNFKNTMVPMYMVSTPVNTLRYDSCPNKVNNIMYIIIF